jgi:metal transporter CNNM
MHRSFLENALIATCVEVVRNRNDAEPEIKIAAEEAGRETSHYLEPGSAGFVLIWMICVGLVLFAALMSGLTMALMSLDQMNLSVLSASGTTEEQEHAKKLSPLLKRRHLLLVTLLIGNAAAMEALPIFLNQLIPEYAAIILSVTFVLIFGEIIPQALFTKHRLTIGSALAPLVWVLQCICFPVSYPIALLLDFFLGKDHPTIYRRAELKELTTLHLMDAAHGHGNLSHDEVLVLSLIVVNIVVVVVVLVVDVVIVAPMPGD